MPIEERSSPGPVPTSPSRDTPALSVPPRSFLALWEAPLAAPATAAALLVAAALLRLWATDRIVAPFYVDEFLYAGVARSLASDWQWWLTDPSIFQFRLYPTVIAPAWLADAMTTTYPLAKAINAVLMTLGVVALYLWARRLLPPRYALLALGLILLLPALLYSGTLLSENGFFPAFVVSLFAIALALERPTVMRQGIVFAAIAVAAAFRLQGLVLALVLPTAIVLKALLELRARSPARPARFLAAELRRYWVSLAALALAAVAYGAMKALQGQPLASGLGLYQGIAQGGYSAHEAVRWIAYHFAELSLSVGLIPLSAFIVLFGLALARGAETSPAERAFLAVSAAAIWWLVLEVGIFASRFALRMEERYMFHVAPLLVLALVLWLERGLPRPPRLAALAALAPAALLVALPVESVLELSNITDAFALVALPKLAGRLPAAIDDLRVALAGGTFLAVTLFLTAPRRFGATAVCAALAIYLFASSYYVLRSLEGYSLQNRLGAGIVGDARWIDHAIGRDAEAALVYLGDPEPVRIRDQFLQTEFWNRSVRTVYKAAPFVICCVPQEDARLDAGTGRIVPVSPGADTPAYAAAGRDAELAGSRVAASGELTLYRPQRPLRLASRSEGIHPDRWMGADAAYSRYVTPGGRPATVAVELSRVAWQGPHVPGTARIELGTLVADEQGQRIAEVTARRSWVIQRGQAKRFVIPTPAPPFRVEVHVEPTFSPTQFGLPDPRQLGVRLQFEFNPNR